MSGQNMRCLCLARRFAKQAIARRARGLLQTRRRLASAPEQNAVRNFELSCQTRNRGGLLPRFLAQSVIESSKLDRKSTRLNSSHVEISYAVFCLKKKKKK